jgi:hypothetical protein
MKVDESTEKIFFSKFFHPRHVSSWDFKLLLSLTLIFSPQKPEKKMLSVYRFQGSENILHDMEESSERRRDRNQWQR